MRALSIPQPWAELVIRGVKTVEVRLWFAKPALVAFPAFLLAGARSLACMAIALVLGAILPREAAAQLCADNTVCPVNQGPSIQVWATMTSPTSLTLTIYASDDQRLDMNSWQIWKDTVDVSSWIGTTGIVDDLGNLHTSVTVTGAMAFADSVWVKSRICDQHSTPVCAVDSMFVKYVAPPPPAKAAPQAIQAQRYDARFIDDCATCATGTAAYSTPAFFANGNCRGSVRQSGNQRDTNSGDRCRGTRGCGEEKWWCRTSDRCGRSGGRSDGRASVAQQRPGSSRLSRGVIHPRGQYDLERKGRDDSLHERWVAQDASQRNYTMMSNILWGIRQVMGPAILGLVLGSTLLAIQGTNAAEKMGVPAVRFAIAYAVGLTLAGIVLGLGRLKLVTRAAARWIGTIAVFVMIVAILEILLIDKPKASQALLIGLCAVLAPMLAIPVADGAWRRHFEQRDDQGSE